MGNKQIFYAGALLLGVFISAISQVMLKKAALKQYSSPIREYLNPLVIIAYIMFGGTTLLSILSYRGIPLSTGVVLESTSYFYVTIFGMIFFKEKLNLKKVLALLLIISGILVYAFFG